MSKNPRRIARSDGKSVALKILENLFLVLTAIFLMHAMKGMTMFKPTLPEAFLPELRLVMTVVALALLVLRKHERPGIWLGLILVWAYVKTSMSSEISMAVFIAITVLGLEGIDHRRILKVFIASVGGALAATVIAGLGGGIPNLVYNLANVQGGLRSCWGTAYPTDFSSLVLFLTMAVWMAWPALPDWTMLLFGLIPLALAFFVTASRNSLLCSLLFEMVVAWHWLEHGALAREGRIKRIRRGVDALLMAAAPLCAILIFALVCLYAQNPAAMERVDNVMSFRLKISANALQTYPLTPFGMKIVMNGGNGGTIFSKGELTFLDSSYVNILLRYGWVTMLAMFSVWEWMLHRALRCGNRRMALVMAVVAFHSVMEHHFPDPFHNILLIMPLASLQVPPLELLTKRNKKRRYAAFAVVAAALLASGILFMPWIMSSLRTIYGAKGWQGGRENAWPVLGLNLCIVAIGAAGAWAVYRLMLAALTRRRGARVAACVLALCLAAGVGVGVWGDRVITQAAQANAAMVDADADVLNCLSECDILSDVMPEVYRRRFANVRRTVLSGDDLARLGDAVVLMESQPEHRVFISHGFKYLQISDEHALYVSDPRALAALTSGGYVATDYYSKAVEVDLERLSKMNNLEWTDGGVLLNGPKKSLTKGPNDELFSGNYAVEYRLFLPEDAMDSKGEICELRVANSTQGELTRVAVNRDQFDSEGWATVTVPVTLPSDTINVRFQVLAGKNRKVGVAGICYRQTPA